MCNNCWFYLLWFLQSLLVLSLLVIYKLHRSASFLFVIVNVQFQLLFKVLLQNLFVISKSLDVIMFVSKRNFHNEVKSFMHVLQILLVKILKLLNLSWAFDDLQEVKSLSQDFSLFLSIFLLLNKYGKVLKI